MERYDTMDSDSDDEAAMMRMMFKSMGIKTNTAGRKNTAEEKHALSLAHSGDLKELEQMIVKGDISPDLGDRENCTLLHYAAMRVGYPSCLLLARPRRLADRATAVQNHTEIATMLLANGAKPNIMTGLASETPLHMAAIYGHAGVVKALLDMGEWPSPARFTRERDLGGRQQQLACCVQGCIARER
jgi:hypothetical protein